MLLPPGGFVTLVSYTLLLLHTDENACARRDGFPEYSFYRCRPARGEHRLTLSSVRNNPPLVCPKESVLSQSVASL